MGSSELPESDKGDDRPPGTAGKIQRTVESMVKQMEISNEEIKYRMKNFDNVDILKKYVKYLKCTKCNQNFQHIIKKGKSVGIHPLLGVLMCDSCRDYYGDGNFSLDSEGEDKYCRWCGEGGTIFACSKCICGFCDVCIKKHFGESGLEAVKNDDDWVCYFCNPEPLWCLRSICFFAKEAAKSKRELLDEKKDGKGLKKKRRKKENMDGSNKTSSESSSSSRDSVSKKQTKRKRLTKHKEKVTRGDSSSSEDEKENHVTAKRRLFINKGQDGSVESDEKTPKKKQKKVDGDETAESEFATKKTLVLEKLTSIWKLTKTVSEVGLNSSRQRLKHLSKAENFNAADELRSELEKVKSCINVLSTSLNAASSSLDSIKEDLTVDTAKDEREIFQSQESELKKFANKFQEESNMEASVDSDGDASTKEIKENEGNETQPPGEDEKSAKDSVEEEKTKDSVESSSRESSQGKERSVSVSSESSSEKEKRDADKEDEKRDEDKENRGSGDETSPVKPRLKVKSFARMLDENVYDKNKTSNNESNSVVIDLYDIDTEESEGEVQNVTETSEDKGKTAEVTPTAGEKKSRDRRKPKTRQDDKAEPKEPVEGETEKKLSSGDESQIKKKSEDEGKRRKSGGRRKRQKKRTSCEKTVEDGNKGKSSDESDGNEVKKTAERRKKQKMQSPGEKSPEPESLKPQEEEEKENNEKSDAKEKEKEEEEEGDSESVKEVEKEVSDREKDEEKVENEADKKLSESESEGEERAEKKDSSDDESGGSSEEELKRTRKTRNKKTDKKELKASFEKFKRKRQRFLKSTQTQRNSSPDNGKDEVKASKLLESSESEGEKKEPERKSGRLSKKRIIASSDEENGEGAKQQSDTTEDEESEKENQNQKSDSEVPKPSSGDTSSDDEMDVKSRSRIKNPEVGNSDSSEEDTKLGIKKEKGNASASSGDEDSKKKKKGRKNIKKILKKDSLQVETKEALRNEEERKKRVKERQKLFEELFPDEKQIILDFDPETKEPLVRVHKKLAKRLKPHQVKGVKFMWDNCFESVKRLEEDSGSGCILAHCMGLGKTLQVITLVHTVMTHDLGVHTVLIVCPLSTVSNWIREFEMWLSNVHTYPITLYDLLKYKKQEERRFHLEDWHKNGGVLVLSYDLFRNLTKGPPKKERGRKKRFQELFETTLLDPGPDLVVCDEGHLLKNEGTALSKSMSRVKTSRRIVLTGTPLQNNLIEYHCMVQFVKPNILGTKKEFCNRFVNPINNGQFEDSTELDVKIMKRRSHVLHSMLEGCIQRFDYSVLTPFLPEKLEYVLSISLTKTQAKTYLHFIKNISARSSGSSRVASLFNDYHNLQRIWTHPRTMLMQSQRESQRDALKSESEGSLKDFIVSSSEEESVDSSDSSMEEVVPKKRILRSNANDPEVKKAIEEEEALQSLGKRWWESFYDKASYDDMRESNKLVILFDLLKRCGELKDKVLVFSQSLYSLDLIEYFLWRIHDNTKRNEETLCGHRGTWVPGTDYFRLDGSTTSETRATWCKYFNKESNTRARLFLISTRAGGLGINLYGANRVVIFDASWNPSHDLQSIFRVYRFGQKKTCYIYRFLSEATMEEKIYERQVTKLSLAHRVVDEHQIERHYSMGNLQELYTFEPTPKSARKIPKLPKDNVLADLLTDHKSTIVGYHEHDSLLENKQEEELSEEERKAAWKEYEDERVQKTMSVGVGVQPQMVVLPPGQLPPGATGIRIVGPAFLGQMNPGQNFVNPMYIQTNIPLEVLQRGLQVGLTPLPNESLESYFTRIFNRESWLQAGQPQ